MIFDDILSTLSISNILDRVDTFKQYLEIFQHLSTVKICRNMLKYAPYTKSGPFKVFSFH